MDPRRIAVLVDGDNISARHFAQVIAAASGLGRVDIARVYAAANRPSDWLTLPGYRLMHAGQGKNAADVLLCIDAMELALVGGLETFVIATSDGDFTHLAQRLRERGQHVLGLGEEKAPMSFRLACTDFVLLNPLSKCTAEPEKTEPVAPPAKPADKSKLDLDIRSIIAKNSQKGAGMRITDLSAVMYKEHGVRISKYPERSWRGYLSKRPTLYDLDPRGPEAKVRFRRT